jgi:hypothetical protein
MENWNLSFTESQDIKHIYVTLAQSVLPNLSRAKTLLPVIAMDPRRMWEWV